MKKWLLLTIVGMGFMFVAGSASAQLCWKCQAARASSCRPFNGSGGCNCIEGNSGGYHICATCGFCSFRICLYGCGSAPIAGLDIVATNNITIPARIETQSETMAYLVSFVQLQSKGCTNWTGHGTSLTGPQGFDWQMLTTPTGTIIEAKHDSGLVERTAFTKSGWTYSRNGKLLLSEKAAQ